MILRCILIFTILLLVGQLRAQTVNWEKNYNTNAYGSSVVAVTDGFVALGGTLAFPNYKGYIVRTDLQGNISWEKTYGDANNSILSSAILKAADDGFVVVGEDNSHPYLMKIDANGAKSWDALVMGPGSYGSANSVTVVSDGYVITGYVSTNSINSLFIAKLSLTGSVSWSQTLSTFVSSNGNAIATAPGGFVVTGGADKGSGLETYLIKFDASGNKLWDKTFTGVHSSSDPDQGNSVASTSDGGYIIAARKALSNSSGNTVIDLIKTASDGSLIWRTQPLPSVAGAGHSIISQADGYVIAGAGHILKTDLAGTMIWDNPLNASYTTGVDVASGGNFIVVGSTAGSQVYLANITGGTAPRYFVIVDANNNPIVNKDITFYKGTMSPGNDTKIITQTTDANGKVKIDPSWYDDGDNIRAGLTVQTAQTQKPLHSTLEIAGVAYRILLDNIKFDERTSLPLTNVTFDKYTGSPSVTEQKLTLDHTTIVFDLMVSIEWDADNVFTDEMKKGLLLTSNYLYDVFDGQVALGNIAVYDDKMNWNGADILFTATTETWPHAGIKGFLNNSIGDGNQILLPRRWFGSIERTRETTVNDNWLESFTESAWRTLGHELGHQLLGFFDEYKDVTGAPNDAARGYYNLGYMDMHYADSDQSYFTTLDKVFSSELSSAERYRNLDKSNIQWVLNKSDCWTQFEKEFEGVHNGVYCPIYKPSERTTKGAGTNYLIGPNDKDYLNSKYDISSIEKQTIFNPNTSNLIQNVWTLTAGSTPGNLVQALLKKKASGRLIDLGLTSSQGKIRFLGGETGDIYTFTGYFGGKNTGQAVSLTSTLSISPKDGKNSISSADTSIQLHLVDGEYRFVPLCNMVAGKVNIGLNMNQPFSTTPSSVISFDDGSSEKASYQFDQINNVYSATMDSLPIRGIILYTASDKSNQPFMFPLQYSTGAFSTNMFGDNGGVVLMADSMNTGIIHNITFISSNFATLLNGLEAGTEQAGNVHSIILPDDVSTFKGMNGLTIRYSHGDVTKHSEQTLRIYKWDEGSSQWTLIGGMVDTASQEINAPITTGGTYAAFTTTQGSGVIETGAVNNSGLTLSAVSIDSRTTVHLILPEREFAEVAIYNSVGVTIATLTSGQMESGSHDFVWDNSSVPNGMYYCTVKSDSGSRIVKIIVVR